MTDYRKIAEILLGRTDPVTDPSWGGVDQPLTTNPSFLDYGWRRRMERGAREFWPNAPLSKNVEDRRFGYMPQDIGPVFEWEEPREAGNLPDLAGRADRLAEEQDVARQAGFKELMRRFDNYDWPDPDGHFRSGGQWLRDLPRNPDDYYRAVGLLPPLPAPTERPALPQIEPWPTK